VVTNGRQAAPHLGGNEERIEVLKKWDIRLRPIFPALVPLKVNPHFGSKLKGVKVMPERFLFFQISLQSKKKVRFSLLNTVYPDRRFSSSVGVLFKHSLTQQPVFLALDLFPFWSAKQIMSNLDQRFSFWPRQRSIVGPYWSESTNAHSHHSA